MAKDAKAATQNQTLSTQRMSCALVEHIYFAIAGIEPESV
jgi:hypothetical protein